MNIPCRQRKVAAGKHVPVYVDKCDQLACQATFGAAGGKLEAPVLYPFTPFLGLLETNTVVMRRAGGPDKNIFLFPFHLVMPVEQGLIVFGGDKLFHDLLSTPGRHDHEHIPRSSPYLLGQPVNLGDFILVPASKGRIDQKAYAVLPEEPGGIYGVFKGARLLAEIVMDLGRGPVKTERDHAYAGILYPGADLRSHKGAVGGKAHPQGLFCAVTGNFKYVFSQQRLSA